MDGKGDAPDETMNGQKTAPGPAELNFDRIAAEYDATRGGTERARTAAADLAPHLVPGEVLEIGVGTGIVAAALLREVPHLHRMAGVDISAEMLHRARRRLPRRVIRASALRLPFRDQEFDTVIAVHVLHLVTDLEATLAEAARVLRPGGRVVAIHGQPDESEDELTVATRSMRAVTWRREDSVDAVRAAGERAGLLCVDQHRTLPRTTRHSPRELADLISGRSWSSLWRLSDAQWEQYVEPTIAALRALPDQDRPRIQESRTTVTVLQRD